MDILDSPDFSFSSFNSDTTFGELSDLFVNNADLFSYNSALDVTDGLTLEELDSLDVTDFKALDYAFVGDEIFDADYYLANNPDVLSDGVNPFTHYIESSNDFDPNPLFDTSYYLEQNPEVLLAGINPLQHFAEIGSNEGASPNPVFAQPNQVLITSEELSADIVGSFGSGVLYAGANWPGLVLEGAATIVWGAFVGIGDLLFNGETITPEVTTDPFLVDIQSGEIISVNPPPFPLPEGGEISLEVFPDGSVINPKEALDGSILKNPDYSELEFSGLVTTPREAEALDEVLGGPFVFPDTEEVVPGTYVLEAVGEPNWSEGFSEGANPNITIGSATIEDSITEQNIRETIANSSLPSRTRSKFRVGGGNIAFADYSIDGETGNIRSFSGPRNLDGFAPFVPNEQRTLKATEVGQFVRDVDTEAKILEQILEQTTPESVGTIRLFSKLPVCDSCGKVIEQFIQLRPNIEIEVIEGI